jgi:hypothetical protein
MTITNKDVQDADVHLSGDARTISRDASVIVAIYSDCQCAHMIDSRMTYIF